MPLQLKRVMTSSLATDRMAAVTGSLTAAEDGAGVTQCNGDDDVVERRGTRDWIIPRHSCCLYGGAKVGGGDGGDAFIKQTQHSPEVREKRCEV